MNNRSRTLNSIYNIAGGLVFKLIGTLCPFIIRSIIIQTLGAQYLGINTLFSSILMVLSLSDLGIGSALVYQMYKPLAEGDNERVCALLKVYRNCYRIIGVVILVIGACLVPFLPVLVSGEFPLELNMYVLYFIYLINTVLSYFLFAYKKSLLDANQKSGIESVIATFTSTAMYIAQIVGLLVTKNYYVYAILLPISTLCLNIVRSVIVDRLYPQFVCRGSIEKGFSKILLVKVRALIGHKLGTTVITTSDSIIVSSMLGLTVLGQYGNYHQIINSLIGIITVVYLSLTASIGNSLITADKEQVEKNFNTLTFLNNWLVGWCSVCLFVLFQPFMIQWMGEDMLFSMPIMVSFVLYFYAWLSRRIGLTYKDAAGMWEQDFWKPYIGAVLNLTLNLLLCKLIGVVGVVISTIIVMVFVYYPWETYILYKHLFQKSPIRYVARMALYFVSTVCACLITTFAASYVNISGWFGLFIKAGICLIIPNIWYVLVYCRTNEFKDAFIRIKRLFSKRLK